MTEAPGGRPVAALVLPGHVLATNAVLNLAGNLAPLAVAIAATPPLVASLGLERFGVLALAWALLGYVGLLDLGVGRALTREVAVRLAERRGSELGELVWSSVAANALAGVAAGAAVLALGSWVVSAMDLGAGIRAEAYVSIAVLSVSMPFVMSTASLRGVLEAHQRFGAANAIRIPLAVATFAAPLIATAFASGLPPAVAALTLARIVGWLAHWEVVRRLVPGLGAGRPSLRAVRSLVRSAAWLNVSGVVSPLLVTIDRLYIATAASAVAVAHYAVPYEVVTRLWVFPSAVVGVLFPALAFAHVADRPRVVAWSARAIKYIYVVMLPPILVGSLFPSEVLGWWLGDAFSPESARVLRWLSIGLFVNSLAFVPYTIIQGLGRADLTGKLHLLEVLPYALVLWLLVGRYGADGAAAAWAGRLIVDAAVLFVLAVRLVPEFVPATSRTALALLPAVGAFSAGFAIESAPERVVVFALAGAAFFIGAQRVIGQAEVAFLMGRRGPPASNARDVT